MAIETKKPETIGDVGGTSASPKVMQANKPDLEPLQRQKGGVFVLGPYRMLVRPLAEILQEEKPKKALILTAGAGFLGEGSVGIYREMLGREANDALSVEEAYRGVALIVSEVCSGSGVQTEIMHVRSLGETVESLKEQLLATGELQNPEAPVPYGKFGEALKTRDADLALLIPGCLCCFHQCEKPFFEESIKKFGNDKVFLLTPNMEHMEEQSFSTPFISKHLIVNSTIPEKDYMGAFRQLIINIFGGEIASFAESWGFFTRLDEDIKERVIAYQRSLELKKFLEKAFFVI